MSWPVSIGGALLVTLRWQAFSALFGFAPASLAIVPKAEPLLWIYIASVLGLTLVFEVRPYLEELLCGLRHRRVP